MSAKCRYCGTFTLEGKTCVGCGASFSLWTPESFAAILHYAGALLRLPYSIGFEAFRSVFNLEESAEKSLSVGYFVAVIVQLILFCVLIVLSQLGVALAGVFSAILLTSVIAGQILISISRIPALGYKRYKEGSLLAYENSLEKALPQNIHQYQQLKALPLKTEHAKEESQRVVENLKLIIKRQAIALFLIKIDKLFLGLAAVVNRPAHKTAEEYRANLQQMHDIKVRIHDELRLVQGLCPKSFIDFEPDIYSKFIEMEALCDAKSEELTIAEAHRISGDIKLLENQELASVVMKTRHYQGDNQHFWLQGQAEMMEKWKHSDAHYQTLGEARVIRDTTTATEGDSGKA